MNDNKKFYMHKALEENLSHLKDSIKDKNLDSVFIYLSQFLFWVFSIREKVFHTKKETDNIYLGLKDYYNMLKHDYSMNEIIKSTLLISPKTYPYTYPYAYGIQSPIVRFQTISKIKKSEVYELNIKDKNVLDLFEKIINETLFLLK